MNREQRGTWSNRENAKQILVEIWIELAADCQIRFCSATTTQASLDRRSPDCMCSTARARSRGAWAGPGNMVRFCLLAMMFTFPSYAVAAQVSEAPTNTPPSMVEPAQQSATAPQSGALIQQTQGKTLYSFTANALDLRTALATFARANNLNIVPDNDIAGTVTVDVRELALEQMMRALLEASDCAWHEEGGLIRVKNTDTRTFTVDYLRMARNSRANSSATLNSATAATGSSGGGGGGASGGGAGGGGGGGAPGGVGAGGSSVTLAADNPIDFWKELKEELGFILTPAGRTSMSINMTAGILQITDRPSALKRAESYLKGVEQSVKRQVDLEAKIYDVALNDQFQFGIDWVHLAEAYGGAMGFGGATLPVATGGGQLQNSALSGLNTIIGNGGGPFSLIFSNFNTAAAVNALKLQGNVEIISQPRLRTLNNQTALIKVGTETPFFSQTTETSQSAGGNVTTSGDQITTVTVGTILSITPQISDNDFVTLDLSPVLTALESVASSPSKTATAPVLDTKQASTIIRVHDGTTVVLGGLIQTERAKSDKKIPVLGDIPLLGKLFTGTYRSKVKKELVIFITPHVVRETETSAPPYPEESDDHRKS